MKQQSPQKEVKAKGRTTLAELDKREHTAARARATDADWVVLPKELAGDAEGGGSLPTGPLYGVDGVGLRVATSSDHGPSGVAATGQSADTLEGPEATANTEDDTLEGQGATANTEGDHGSSGVTATDRSADTLEGQEATANTEDDTLEGQEATANTESTSLEGPGATASAPGDTLEGLPAPANSAPSPRAGEKEARGGHKVDGPRAAAACDPGLHTESEESTTVPAKLVARRQVREAKRVRKASINRESYGQGNRRARASGAQEAGGDARRAAPDG
jgi:hypothetical protein